MRSIQEIGQEIKNWLGDALAEWGLITVVFLAVLGSFGLGRLSVREGAWPPVSITHAAAAAAAQPMASGGLFVGSKTGTAYYFPWCGSAAKIRLENQRWFHSEAEARAALYAPAKNCPGLQ